MRIVLVSLALVVGVALGRMGAEGSNTRLEAAEQPRFKAVAFDYLVPFNPDSIVSDVEEI